MNREDEMIREALKVDVSPSEMLNNEILRTVGRKKSGHGILRALATAAACLIVFVGTVTLVDAASGGSLLEYVKEKLAGTSYIYGNGSTTTQEIVEDEDGKLMKKVTYVEDGVMMGHYVDSHTTEYSLYLKIVHTDRGRTINSFYSMTTIAKDDTSDEELYYSVRGSHRTVLLNFNKPDEKAQVLEALRAAAEKTDVAAVRNGYLDLADDLEENRKILYYSLPGEFWGEDGYIVFFEDLTEFPKGEYAVIADSVVGHQCWIIEVQVTDNNVDVRSAITYTEENCEEAAGSGKTICDRRKTR